ncbi:hypothetical protein BU17DRAFT_60322 [Hysterangium stoloniferum]|nr:hypothetical protein BU17DRAFT_60322 [Hysterangium stoloniferum]
MNNPFLDLYTSLPGQEKVPSIGAISYPQRKSLVQKEDNKESQVDVKNLLLYTQQRTIWNNFFSVIPKCIETLEGMKLVNSFTYANTPAKEPMHRISPLGKSILRKPTSSTASERAGRHASITSHRSKVKPYSKPDRSRFTSGSRSVKKARSRSLLPEFLSVKEAGPSGGLSIARCVAKGKSILKRDADLADDLFPHHLHGLEYYDVSEPILPDSGSDSGASDQRVFMVDDLSSSHAPMEVTEEDEAFDNYNS